MGDMVGHLGQPGVSLLAESIALDCAAFQVNFGMPPSGPIGIQDKLGRQLKVQHYPGLPGLCHCSERKMGRSTLGTSAHSGTTYAQLMLGTGLRPGIQDKLGTN